MLPSHLCPTFDHNSEVNKNSTAFVRRCTAISMKDEEPAPQGKDYTHTEGKHNRWVLQWRETEWDFERLSGGQKQHSKNATKSMLGYNCRISRDKRVRQQKLWKSTQDVPMIKHWIITHKRFQERDAMQQWIQQWRFISYIDLLKCYEWMRSAVHSWMRSSLVDYSVGGNYSVVFFHPLTAYRII